MKARRETLETYRDALLILAFQSPMKRTRMMNGLGTSWTSFKVIEEELSQKKLIRKISTRGLTRREMRKIGADDRNMHLVEITEKGKIVLRWLDAMLQYINDTGSTVLPPTWVLQSIFRQRSSVDPLQLEAPFYLQVLPGKMFQGEAFIKAFFRVQASIFSPRGYIIRIHCPECGAEVNGVHGLKVHIGKIHRDEKDRIMEKITPYLNSIAHTTKR